MAFQPMAATRRVGVHQPDVEAFTLGKPFIEFLDGIEDARVSRAQFVVR